MVEEEYQMPMKVQVPLKAKENDDRLGFIQQMGIEYASLFLRFEELNQMTIMQEQEWLQLFGIKVSDIACPELQKNKKIILGLEGRDEEIDKFKEMLRILGEAGIAYTSVAWQPNGILRTGHKATEQTRGGISGFADMAEILSRPNTEDRVYGGEEIWENFKYFLDKVLPVCEETGVRIALHPNDPPLPTLGGVASLIHNTETFRRAFKLAGNSKALGMKLCIGCWLEGGTAFGSLMEDIKEFCSDDRILCVHFRNVSSPIPYFEETLAEDGYANMYAIMKTLVASDCNATISIDHAFKAKDGMGGMHGAFAYPTGYMKGLMHAAEIELGKRKYRTF